MALFSSARERFLWFWTIAVLLAIFSTLGLAQTLAGVLGRTGAPEVLFAVGMLLVLATIVSQGTNRRPAGREIAVASGVIAVYLLMFVRMSTAAERTHLMEYGVVAILIYEALAERVNQGHSVPAPALIAIIAAAAIGVLDESIQLFLPSRVFDPRDILVNVLASIMAVCSSMGLSWARQRMPSD